MWGSVKYCHGLPDFFNLDLGLYFCFVQQIADFKSSVSALPQIMLEIFSRLFSLLFSRSKMAHPQDSLLHWQLIKLSLTLDTSQFLCDFVHIALLSKDWKAVVGRLKVVSLTHCEELAADWGALM